MHVLDPMTGAVLRLQIALYALRARVVSGGRDRGDVPGWVLVTIMTAGLVTVLWALAGDRLRGLLDAALTGVTGPGA